MEEKELVRRIKNSLKTKKSRAEILSGFQKRGYKLAYAEELIKKAKRPKRIIGIFLVSVLIFFSLTFSIYTLFSNQEKMELKNPLIGFSIIEDKISENSLIETDKTPGEIMAHDNFSLDPDSGAQKMTYDQVEITPEFISFLLNELGAWKLHRNPITLQNPIINFKIENKDFHSEITNIIKTFDGFSDSADLLFDVNKQDLVDSILDENPEKVFTKSISSGRTSVDILSSEANLFAKGYLELYETLNSPSPL